MARVTLAIQSWFKKIAKRALPKGQFARNVTFLAGGTALGQLVTVLVSPILTRLYAPKDFGVFGVYASVLGIVTVLASLRYEYAIPLPEEDQTAADLLVLCFMLLIGVTGFLSIFIFAFKLGNIIVTWANAAELHHYLWMIPLGMLGAGTYQILNYWTIRKRDFPTLARTRINRGLARASLQVGIGIFHPGPLGLLLGQLVGESAGSLSLGLAMWKRDHSLFRNISLKRICEAGMRYKRFPLFLSWAGFLNGLGLHVPQLLFAAFYGAEVAGWFALGQRVIAAPLNIVVDSVAQVYFGEAARLPKDNPERMRQLFLRITGKLALIGGLPVALICIAAPWFFRFVFGHGWETAGKYVQILGIMFAVRFVTIPLSHTLNILERQDLYLFWDITRLVFMASAFLAGKVLALSHIATVGIYSLSMSIAYFILWLLAWRALTGI